MTRKAFLCICFLCVAFWAYCEISETESVHQETTQTVDRTDEWREAYGDLILKESVKRAALLYLDEDATPELLTLKNGEYHLYTFDGLQTAAINMPHDGIKANAYGPGHDFEDRSDGLIFYWFEYVPYQGLIRVHGSEDEKRCDYYLDYTNGSLELELEVKASSTEWKTYSAYQEITNEEFLRELSDRGYDKLIPCDRLCENIADFDETMSGTSNSREVLEDFVSGKIDALYEVEDIADVPEDAFVMKNYEDIYREVVIEDADGSIEYADFDNDGEEELIMSSNTGACAFFDVIGGTVYKALETHSTADIAYVAEMKGKKVIAMSDLSQGTTGGRQKYRVIQYDACGCPVDFFELFAFYDGTSYSAEDRFRYRWQDITMEEFEEIRDNIRRISSVVRIKNVGMDEEFYSFQGKWIIDKCIDSAVEFSGVDINTEEYKRAHEKRNMELQKKYEGYTFEICIDSIAYFGAPNMYGYHCDGYEELFISHRQPPTLEIVPPFLCASVQLKDVDEKFDIIIDADGDAVLEVSGYFFELNRASRSSVSEEEKERGDNWQEAYQNLLLEEDVKRAALLYLDEDATPELLTLKNGEYHLYTFDGSQAAAVNMPDDGIMAKAYAPKHALENFSGDLAFCWFEYVPYQGLMRIHGGDEDRCDYYLRYQNGSTALELEAKFTDFIWHTYSAEEEIENEEFLSRLSDLGYDELTPCAFLYDNIDEAYENMGKTLKSSEVMEDFVNGKIDALYQVEEAADIPEEGFVMRSYVDLYRDLIMGDGMGSMQYVDFDNDGEDELIMRDYMGNSIFLDVIGGTVYSVMEASGTANQAYAAEMEGKRVVVNADVSHGGRKFYIVKQYDSCGCLVDFFRLFASYDGKDHYSAEDSFKYREQQISMETFEEIKNAIRDIPIEENSAMKDDKMLEEFIAFQGECGISGWRKVF